MLSKLVGVTTVALIASLALAQQQTDPTRPPPCEKQPFCDRFRQFVDNADLRAHSDTFYSIDRASVVVDKPKGQIQATLTLASHTDGIAA